jgi:hypothetical protein
VQPVPQSIARVGGIAPGPAGVDAQVAAFTPAQFLQALHERREARLSLPIVPGQAHKHTDVPNCARLLRPCRERPCDRRAAEKGDELAPPQVPSGIHALCNG